MNQAIFKVYKSSAGSGKTTTLVQEYLKIALVNPSKFREIVGITFTIKATNEMKSRVIEALIDLSEGIFKSEMQSIIDELKSNHGFDDEHIRLNAAKLLSNILHGYSYFAFSTIDSFVVGLVRSFAFDLRLPLNFGIELQTQIIIDEAVAALLDKAGYDVKLTKFLINFIENRASDENDTRLPVLLGELSKVLFNDSYADFTESLKYISTDELYVFADEIIKKTNIKKNEISNLGKRAVELVAGSGLEASDFHQGSRGIFKYFQYLSEVVVDKLSPNSYVVTTLEEDKWISGKCSLSNQASLETIKLELSDLVFKAQNLVPDYLSHLVLRKNIEAVALLKQVHEMIQMYYTENSVIHLSETLKRVSEVVSQEQVPFIYERLGNQYNHYLIDEFQDTSTRQWHNLLPLIDDSLSSGNFNLIVGDAKQSIYRWRGGDFEQFVNLPLVPGSSNDSIIASREESLIRYYSEVILHKNYRSSLSVVDFNNDLYKYCLGLYPQNEILQNVFRDFKQTPFKKNKGYVEIRLLEKGELEEIPINKAVIQIIQDLKSRNYPLNNIAILARKNRSLTQMAEILLENNIPVISSQSLKLNASPHIQFLINILRWISEPTDKVSILAAYQYLFAESFLGEDFDFLNLFSENNLTIDSLLLLLNLPSSELDFDDATQVVEFFAHHLNLLNKDYAFILHLLGFIHKSQNSVGNGISAFLVYFDKYSNDEYVALPENIDAVHLISIHKSKGLEYPVVLFCDFESHSGKNTDFLTVSPKALGFEKPLLTLISDNKIVNDTCFSELKIHSEKLAIADSFNISYVATTRAKNELYILSEEKSAYNEFLEGFTLSDNQFSKNEEGNLFSNGEKIILEKSLDIENNAILNYDYFQPWQEKISLNRSLLSEVKNKNIERESGNKIHDLLAQVKNGIKVEELINSGIKSGLILYEEQGFYKEILESVYNNSQLEFLFNTDFHILNERSILTQDGKLYRPDRVMLSENDFIIVDYKYSNPEDVGESRLEKYKHQVTQYVDSMREIYPNKSAKGFLLWLKDRISLEEVYC